MVPARGEWNATLKRAAGERARQRRTRLKDAQIVARGVDRKGTLAAILKRK
jgi:hypothetical protein